MAIQWRDNVYYLDSVQLPNDEKKYWIKDTEAREAIETLSNATHFLGVTTTALADGATTNPITIDSKSVAAQSGDIVIYNAGTELAPENKEFIFNGTAWQEFGDPSIQNLGNMAYANTASTSYTPTGNITLSQTDVEEGEGPVVVLDVSHSFAVSLELASEYSEGFDQVYMPSTTISVITGVSNMASSTIYVVDSEQSVVKTLETSSVVAGQQLTSGTLPTLTKTTQITASVSNTTLVFGSEALGFNAGAFPTYSFATMNTISSYTTESLQTSSLDITISVSVEASTISYWDADNSGNAIYYKAELTGNLEPEYSRLQGTFTGAAASITVTPDPKQ